MVTRPQRLPLLALSVFLTLCAGGLAWAMPSGTVIIRKTGQEFSDVEWDINGDVVEVKFKGRGSRFWRVEDVILVPMSEHEQHKNKEEGKAHHPRSSSWHARCRLSVPDDDWTAAPPSIPDAVIELQRGDAKLVLRVRPAEEPFTFQRSRGGETSGFLEDMQLNFHGLGQLRVGIESLFGERVYALGPLGAEPIGWDDKLQLKQIRFRRYGLEYVLSLIVPQKQSDTLKQADELFAGFSFLPSVESTPDSYADYGHGFSIRRPAEDWQLVDRPFSDSMPAELRSSDGRAEVTASLVQGDDEASTYVRRMLQERKQKSRYYESERVASGTVDGCSVEKFMFEDFKTNGRKQLRFKGFAARVQGRLLVVIGYAPLTDSDARKLQEEVDRTLGSVRLYDVDSVCERLRSQRDAAEKVSSGYSALEKKDWSQAIDDLDEAIQANDDYALAYYLRGEAKRGSGDFDGFRADLDKAAQLDPEAGYDKALAPSYADEAKQADKDREFQRSAELYMKAYRLSEDREYLKSYADAMGKWWRDASKGRGMSARDLHRLVGDLEGEVKAHEDEPEIINFLAKLYKDGGTRLKGMKEYAKAKRWARKLRGLDGHRDEGEKLYDQIRNSEKANSGR